MIKVIGLNTKVLKKEPFSGSHHGMRFFMRAENDILHVWVYPEQKRHLPRYRITV